MKPKTKKLTFKYEYHPDYNQTYVNGAFGGISPRGDLVINFYMERQSLPYSEEVEITEGVGAVRGKLLPEDLPDTVTRYVESGIVITPNTAKQIYDWLGLQLKNIEEQRNNTNIKFSPTEH